MRKVPVTCCLVFATGLEASPFLKGLGLKALRGCPFPAYRKGKLGAVICGIGKANAAMATAWACAFFSPRGLVNLGAAGSLTRRLKPGDMLQVTKAVEADRPGLRTGRPHEHRPDTLRGFKGAVVATADKPVLRPADREKLARLAALADMESAAFIQTCRAFKRKCYLFKFVTDGPDNPASSDILANIRKYRSAFSGFVSSSVLPRL
ncbi:MAG: hypothetical protein M0025_02310 [Elusimicrobia bacterium]|nr:hypothetical protein [Elusimicrobiota bacterium]